VDQVPAGPERRTVAITPVLCLPEAPPRNLQLAGRSGHCLIGSLTTDAGTG
jgi:hypothetical protein